MENYNMTKMASSMPGIANSTILPFLLGVSMHHGVFIHGEWHHYAPSIVVGHFASFMLLITFKIIHESGIIVQAAVEEVVSASIYLLGLFLSIAVYRLFFHRLRSFPGSRLASLSKLWHVWMCRKSKGHRVLESWQTQYGSIVRTGQIGAYISAQVYKCLSNLIPYLGPNEITLFHPAAFEFLDGFKNENTRSDWHDMLHPRSGAIFTRDKNAHKARRRVWESALNTTGNFSSTINWYQITRLT